MKRALSSQKIISGACNEKWIVNQNETSCYSNGTDSPHQCHRRTDHNVVFASAPSPNLWPTQVCHAPKRQLDRFICFCRAHGRHQQIYTDRQTDHATCDICSNSPQLAGAAMRAGEKIAAQQLSNRRSTRSSFPPLSVPICWCRLSNCLPSAAGPSPSPDHHMEQSTRQCDLCYTSLWGRWKRGTGKRRTGKRGNIMCMGSET